MRMMLLVALVGCATKGASGFEVDGTVASGPSVNTDVVIVWDNGTTLWKWGGGTGTPTTFTVTLSDVPPPAAQNPSSSLAVGYPVLVPQGTTVPDGVTALGFGHFGIATDYAIIWQSATATQQLAWQSNFGAGYSCGHCVRDTTGAALDSWELTACTNETIVNGDELPQVCHWH